MFSLSHSLILSPTPSALWLLQDRDQPIYVSHSLQPRWRCHSIPAVPISSYPAPSPYWKPSSSYRIPITTRAHNNLISPRFNGPSLIRLQLTAAARCRFKWPSFILFYLNKVEKTKSFQKKNMLTRLLRLRVSLVFTTCLPTFVLHVAYIPLDNVNW